MTFSFAPEGSDTVPVYIVESAALAETLAEQNDVVRAVLLNSGFEGNLGQLVPVYGETGELMAVFVGYGTPAQRRRGRFHLARAGAELPEGDYHLVTTLEGWPLAEAALGWLLSAYYFDRYRSQAQKKVRIICPPNVNAAHIERLAQAEALTRDLINTPANDMGPAELETIARDLAGENGAAIKVITGSDLIEAGFPLIHMVGRASAHAPRLIDFTWGTSGPSITLVGKGVCFDSGGLNIKPGNSMGLMKKDMGGAANILGLAHLIMRSNMAVRLRVLIPAAENAIAGNAFRPGDIVRARNGLSIEINNTDAEGRLVLADALAFADENRPDMILSMATLTGAARVAVGPDLAPFFSTDQNLSDAIRRGGQESADPVWEMPFWPPYEKMIEPKIADLDNAPASGFAGAITAALFLRRFVKNPRYVHFDLYGWRPTAQAGWPKGGLGQGSRAVFHALGTVFPETNHTRALV